MLGGHQGEKSRRDPFASALKIRYLERVPGLVVLVSALLASTTPGDDEVRVQLPPSGAGGTVYAGAGPTFVAAKSAGVGLSYDLALELGRALVVFDLLGATGVRSYGTALGTASAGAVLLEADRAPYILGGIGYLARGIIGGDPSGSRRDHVVLTAEAGYIFGRARRWGQMWAGLRALIPIATTSTQGSPLPDLPWALVTVRLLL
jgi:hypothetical protein